MRWLLFAFTLRRSKISDKDSWWLSTNPSPNPGGERDKIQGSRCQDKTSGLVVSLKCTGSQTFSKTITLALCLLHLCREAGILPSTVQRVRNWQKQTHLRVPTQRRCQVTNVEMYSENCMWQYATSALQLITKRVLKHYVLLTLQF